MWILSILPDWAFHAMLLAGILGTIAGFVLGKIPFIQTYITPIRIISILLLSFSLYVEGGIAEKAIWEAKVAALQNKLIEAEARSNNQNTVIVEKIVEKTKYVEGKTKTIVEYIDREVVKDREVISYIERCPAIPESIISSINDAAQLRNGAPK